MSEIISKAALEARRARYKSGARVELVSMNDPYNTALKPGDKGTVDCVDDIGTCHIVWDNGAALGAAYGEDEIRLLDTIDDKVIKAVLAVRATGLTNLFDTAAVQRLAFDMGFYELVTFIEENRKAYGRFILTGEREWDPEQA